MCYFPKMALLTILRQIRSNYKKMRYMDCDTYGFDTPGAYTNRPNSNLLLSKVDVHPSWTNSAINCPATGD